MNIRELICTEIVKRPDRDPQFRNDDVWIRCPYHNAGNESTASMRIRLGSDYKIGSHRCFGCSHWSADWNALAKTLKLKQTKVADQTHDVSSFSFEDITEVELPDITNMHKWPADQPWRNISGETLRKLQARMEYRKNRLMLYLPVHHYDEYVGGVHCELVVTKQLKAEGQKSYLNTDGAWSRKHLFGFDIARKMTGPLWAVEGPRDTANIIQLNGRVVGLLGSYVSPEKIALIEALDPPMVIIATDPDAVGNKAAQALEDGLSYIPTIRVNFPENKDPANLTPRAYEKITKRLSKVS